MSSIATKTGDSGSTGLAGGLRLSKADLRVEAYGTVDELGACLGFARSICGDAEVKGWTEEIQRTLFRVGAALSTTREARATTKTLVAEDVEHLTGLVYKIEAMDGILSDWNLPGANTQSAAYEIARTVCRRAERCAVRFNESDGDANDEALAMVPAVAISYLNRLSDLIWLFGRLIELRAGVDARLRDDAAPGPGFSRAW